MDSFDFIQCEDFCREPIDLEEIYREIEEIENGQE